MRAELCGLWCASAALLCGLCFAGCDLRTVLLLCGWSFAGCALQAVLCGLGCADGALRAVRCGFCFAGSALQGVLCGWCVAGCAVLGCALRKWKTVLRFWLDLCLAELWVLCLSRCAWPKMDDSTAILARFVICTDCADCACRVVLCKNGRQYCDFGKICDLTICALGVMLVKNEGRLANLRVFVCVQN